MATGDDLRALQIKRRTAWVGSLPHHSTEESIRDKGCMGQFGKIESVHLQTRGRGPNSASEDAARASRAANHGHDDHDCGAYTTLPIH